MTRPTRRRIAAFGAAGTLTLALSGCGSHPGAAASVGSDTIDVAQLDRVATVICSAQAQSQGLGAAQEQSSRSNRELALGVLLDSKLSEKYASAVGLEPDRSQLEKAMASRQQLISSVPGKYRSTLTDTLEDLDRSQLTMAEVGRRQLQAAGAKNITAQTALPAGLKVRDAWVAKHLKVEVDPRFGEFSDGRLKAGSGSLSSAMSSSAREAAKSQPSQQWVTSLPASQKCS